MDVGSRVERAKCRKGKKNTAPERRMVMLRSVTHPGRVCYMVIIKKRRKAIFLKKKKKGVVSCCFPWIDG